MQTPWLQQLTGQTQSHLARFDQHHLLQSDALAAFIMMQHAAKRDGIELAIASSFRSFARQQLIWDAKMRGQRAILDKSSQPIEPTTLNERDKILAILHWSAIPGASRHHWGTDIDVYSPSLLPKNIQLQLIPSEYQQGGHQHKLSQWLDNHMDQFGFYLPYSEDRNGVAIEPWHLSYYPVAAQLQTRFTIDHLDHVLACSNVIGKGQLRVMLPTIWQRFIINVSFAPR
ncbi:M15 family metallopeptidase [Motilimonas sp. KMU-193]|uniref:M15 family metallopeptidase n=1 Tax=Motilimonas sp. KMU-193 TaxID=3388668 RepID=UPI00396B1152